MKLKLNIFSRSLDLLKGEHLKPDYIAINPASTVPALIDGDLQLFDSSAMAIHMVEKYAKDDSLYPKDPSRRAKVNEKLFYVASTIFPNVYNVFFPVIFQTATEISKTSYERFARIYDTVEKILSKSEYLAGEEITLPDLFLWSITESMSRLILIDTLKFPKYTEWLKNMRQHPCNAYQQEGADLHVKFFNMSIDRNKKLRDELDVHH